MWNLRTAENTQAAFAITLDLCPGLFVRPNPGLSRASASPFVGATTKQEATVKGVETVASGQHVIARTINERPYTTPRQ